MPKIEIVGPAKTTASDEPRGGKLVDICDDTDAPVPFSCRGGTCGTCRIIVLEGAALLSPPNADERDTLSLFEEAPPRHRLACMTTLLSGEGRVCVRVADER